MKLLDQCRQKLRVLGYALRTERNYLGWIERTIRFCKTPQGFRHPRDLGAGEVSAFLSHLAAERHVSARSVCAAAERKGDVPVRSIEEMAEGGRSARTWWRTCSAVSIVDVANREMRSTCGRRCAR